MPTDMPKDWTKLRCDSCNSIYFLKRMHLITRAGGGTTEEIAGYVCRQCNADVDMGRMIQKLDLERKRAELKELETEVTNAETLAATPAAPASRKG